MMEDSDDTLVINDKTMIKIPIITDDFNTDINFAFTSEEQSVIKKLSKNNAIFIQHSSNSVRPRYLLNTPITYIGRDVKCDIQLEDHSVSRKHVVIKCDEDGQYTAEDTGSLNGIYLNNKMGNSFKLANGDLLQVGKFKLYFFQNN
ncbi:MAG: FHA domain-containing protein [Bifidobacteriaceae bacterium]|jgi:hypothetical protein|nr:FHA domain-containing protein [Bifidobacteriaceae bacterium]